MGELNAEAMQLIVTKMIILILSIAVHEFGHAIVADWLGDRLPRSQGRVTLNPLAHADPIGTLALPGFALLATGGMSTGFGWGRPVQVQPFSFTRRFRMKTGHMFVAAAGPAMNVLFGIVISLVVLILGQTGVLAGAKPQLINALHDAIYLNFVLAVFNLIPFAPLDGGAVMLGLLPDKLEREYAKIAPYGIFVIAAIVITPTLARIFLWPATQFYTFWVGLLGIGI